MRTHVIIRYTGAALIMVALMMAVSALVALAAGGDESVYPLAISSLITFVAGAYPMIFVRSTPDIKPNEGIAIVVVSWIVCCIFGMMPYICYGGEFTIINAFFESVSGFTTTGASILDDIEALPAGLLFWRVSTAWVGGLGIVSFFSLVIPRSMDAMSVLSSAEISDLSRSQSSKRGKSFVRTILTVYIILTVACAASLMLAGMGWFDALTNAMSTCSTCGFCVRNSSIAAYGSVAVEMVILFFMTISGISFMLLSSLVIGGGSGRRLSSTATAFLLFLVGGTVLVTLNLNISAGVPLMESMRLAAFQLSSIATTTGFATADTTLWPSMSILVLIVASVICGCSGSTSGGIKMDRVILLVKYIRNGIDRMLYPNRVTGMRLDGRSVSERYASDAMKYVLVYFAFIMAGSMVNIAFGLDIKTGLSAAIACLGNVGPGFGSVGSMGNYADFPALLKLTNSILMLAGRLEIFPLISLLAYFVSRRR